MDTVPPSATVAFGRVLLPTGITMHYAAQGRPGDGPPLLLLHGYADSWQSFALVLAALPPGLRVFAPDLRGHGLSDKPATGYSLADHVADVAAFMDHMGIVSATVAGHSMGSMIAQGLAVAHGARVGRLVLIGSAARARGNAVLMDLKKHIDALKDPIPREFAEAFQHPSNPVPPDFLRTVIAQSLTIPADIWKAAFDGLCQVDNSADLPGVRAPTAIAWGRSDGLFSRADQHELLALLPASILLEYDAGHALPWERPAELARDIADFHVR